MTSALWSNLHRPPCELTPARYDGGKKMTRTKDENAGWARRIMASVQTFIDARGLFWALLLFVIAFVLPALGIGAAVIWFRDAGSDLLAANVEIWHLLLALTGEGMAVLAGVIWLRRQGTGPKASIWSYCPREIDHFGVLWPITTVHDGHSPTAFKVGKPICPKDRSILGWVIEMEDTDFHVHAVSPLPDWWEKIDADLMRFHCFKDGAEYDLTTHKFGMAATRDIVQNLAWGEYRQSEAEARGNR